MFFRKKIEPKKIKNLIKNFSQKPLSAFFLLLGIALILGLLIYYQEGILPQKEISGKEIKLLELDEKTSEEILKIWQEREKRFKEADSKSYLDFFRLDHKENLR